METTQLCRDLTRYSSCDIADALGKLGVPNCGFIPDLTLWSPQRQQGHTRIVGPAYTVKYEYGSAPQGGAGEQQQPHYVDGAPAGSVIFISCPQGMIHACWGGLTTRRAKKNAVAGTFVDGRLRDLDELRELEYPVFARDVAPTGPSATAHVSEVNGDVSCRQGEATLIIHPGDILLGDLCGVICIPRSLAQDALELVETLARTESQLAEAIDQGMSMTEASKLR